MLGTKPNGGLSPIKNCFISIPVTSTSGYQAASLTRVITVNSLPDLSDTKSAQYSDEPVIGRSFPMKTYSHSENRSISMTLHFFLVEPSDVLDRLQDLRAIESAVYPRTNGGTTPFIPPPVCQIQCGRLLGDAPLCVVLRSYSVRFSPDVAWVEHSDTYLPMKFDVETTWEAIYKSDSLPGQDKIYQSGA